MAHFPVPISCFALTTHNFRTSNVCLFVLRQNLLSDQHLFEMLRARQFDVALVDIISNECGLALAAALKLPVVGFWGFSFVGGEVRTGGCGGMG